MTQNHDDDAAAPRGQSIFTNPWAQAGLTAVLTLVPARNYPRWLRRGIVWAPAVGFAAGSAYLVANPSQLRKLDRQAAGAQGRPPGPRGGRPQNPVWKRPSRLCGATRCSARFRAL